MNDLFQFEVSEIEGPVTTTTPATKKDDDFEVSAKKYEEFKDPIERNGAEVTNDETQFQFLGNCLKKFFFLIFSITAREISKYGNNVSRTWIRGTMTTSHHKTL